MSTAVTAVTAITTTIARTLPATGVATATSDVNVTSTEMVVRSSTRPGGLSRFDANLKAHRLKVQNGQKAIQKSQKDLTTKVDQSLKSTKQILNVMNVGFGSQIKAKKELDAATKRSSRLRVRNQKLTRQRAVDQAQHKELQAKVHHQHSLLKSMTLIIKAIAVEGANIDDIKSRYDREIRDFLKSVAQDKNLHDYFELEPENVAPVETFSNVLSPGLSTSTKSSLVKADQTKGVKGRQKEQNSRLGVSRNDTSHRFGTAHRGRMSASNYFGESESK